MLVSLWLHNLGKTTRWTPKLLWRWVRVVGCVYDGAAW